MSLTPSGRTPALPAHANLDHLRKEAKQRLKALRAADPRARLADAQLALARDYGFASWRKLKAHVDTAVRARVFAAARAGDAEGVRRALAAGFDPTATDDDGRTLTQIAKANGDDTIELLAREFSERDTHTPDERHAIAALIRAAARGDLDELDRLLDRHAELIDQRSDGFTRETALHAAAARNQRAGVELLLERGADVRVRDFPNNATALHFAAAKADLDIVRMLVDAGADVQGAGDDYDVGVLGWATCFQQMRQDVADYLLAQGARLDLWSAIALGRTSDVRRMIADSPALMGARMSRNQRHRTPLHHAAAKNRLAVVRLLLELGADPRQTDAAGASALATAAQEGADPEVVAALLDAGAPMDLLAAVSLKRYDIAERMLRDDPARLGPEGADTIALHLAVAKKDLEAIRWLIAHGIDVSAKRMMWGCNHTALHMATENGSAEIARILLDAGADPNVRDDKFAASVLGWAEFFRRAEIAEMVRARGGT